MKPLELAFEFFAATGDEPLIILHGFLASSRNWRSIAKKLAEYCPVYVVDMRNHGASPHHEAMNYPEMAVDLLGFMDSQGIEKAHILGHSMGGKIAMWFASHHELRVASLMVADISPVSYEHSFDLMIDALKQLPLDQVNNRKQAELFLADAIPDISFRQFLLQNLLLKDGRYFWRINLDIIQNTAHHIVGFPKLERAAFTNSALFIGGQNSTYIKPEAIFQHFPQAEIVEIPNTGHWLYVEAPEAFCLLVQNWMAQSSMGKTPLI